MSGAGDDLKKDFKRMMKHSKRMFKNFFGGRHHKKYDSDDDYRSYDDYFNDYDMETYDESYKTPGGEIVHAFGRYGYDS